MGLTTASQADFIFVLPGHYEDLGAAETVDLDVQGISVIGIGNGPDRPEFVYDATDAEIDIGASGIHVSNLLLQPSIAATVVGIDIETTVTDTFLEDIEGIPGEPLPRPALGLISRDCFIPTTPLVTPLKRPYP